MAYGLSIEGANNSFVFDSTIAGATAMPVIQGSTSATSGQSYSGYTAGDLIFAKPASGVTVISSDWSSTTPKADGNQEFILLRPSDTAGLSTNQNGSTYGLQIFDADGTTVMYDSRHTSSGLDIKAGAGTGFPGGGAFSGGSFVPDTSSSNLVYASANANTYALMSTGYSRVMGFITVKIGYNFSSTNIHYVGYYHYSGYGSSGQGGLPSSSQMIIGDLVT